MLEFILVSSCTLLIQTSVTCHLSSSSSGLWDSFLFLVHLCPYDDCQINFTPEPSIAYIARQRKHKLVLALKTLVLLPSVALRISISMPHLSLWRLFLLPQGLELSCRWRTAAFPPHLHAAPCPSSWKTLPDPSHGTWLHHLEYLAVVAPKPKSRKLRSTK